MKKMCGLFDGVLEEVKLACAGMKELRLVFLVQKTCKLLVMVWKW